MWFYWITVITLMFMTRIIICLPGKWWCKILTQIYLIPKSISHIYYGHWFENNRCLFTPRTNNVTGLEQPFTMNIIAKRGIFIHTSHLQLFCLCNFLTYIHGARCYTQKSLDRIALWVEEKGGCRFTFLSYIAWEK